ncbi:MAG: hypothetical protein WDN67_01825 [Candidatus Moraniibacteriota bacterium]
MILLVLVSGAAAAYFYLQSKETSEVKNVETTNEIVEKIGKFLVLPEGEEPTLATVKDREKLAEEPFFQKAENGDQVLIYREAGVAILYRPSLQKVVNVVSIKLPAEDETSLPQAESAPTSPITRVTILNGSRQTEATGPLEAEINQKLPTLAVVSKENAHRNDYSDTLVVDLRGERSEQAAQLAQASEERRGSFRKGRLRLKMRISRSSWAMRALQASDSQYERIAHSGSPRPTVMGVGKRVC